MPRSPTMLIALCTMLIALSVTTGCKEKSSPPPPGKPAAAPQAGAGTDKPKVITPATDDEADDEADEEEPEVDSDPLPASGGGTSGPTVSSAAGLANLLGGIGNITTAIMAASGKDTGGVTSIFGAITSMLGGGMGGMGGMGPQQPMPTTGVQPLPTTQGAPTTGF